MRPSRLIWLPFPLLLVAIVVLRAVGPLRPHESQALLVALNLLVSGLGSLLVLALVGRSWMRSGAPGLLLLGCGVLFWGAAGTLGPALLGYGGGNVTLTVHNLLAWLSAVCHLGGVLVSLGPWRARRRAGPLLGAAYAAAAVVTLGVTALALRGWFPVFFVQGHGGTELRAWVLGTASGMFAGTALLLWGVNRPRPSAFVHWYGAALLLIATGLLGVLLESALGSAMSWTGRIAQLAGGAYLVMAAIASLREPHGAGISLATALRRSEERYRSLVELAPDAIIVHQAGRLVFVNACAVRLYGASSAGELLGREVLDLVHPDDRAAIRTRMRESTAGARTELREFRILRLDGAPVPVETTGAPIDFGGLPAVHVVLRDVRARRAAEDALRASEALHRAVFESAGDAVIVTDPVGAGRVLSANPAACRLFGYTEEEFLRVDRATMLDPGDEGVRRLLQERSEHGAATAELVYRRKDGSTFIGELRVASFTDRTGAPRAVATIRDISDRRRIEEQVIRERDLLQHVMDGARDSHLVFLDRDFNFVRVNETYARGCGYRPEEMIGRNHFALYPHPENEAIFARVRDTGEPVAYRDKPFTFPDQPARGTTFWDWTLTPVKDGRGVVIGLVLGLFDTTERVRAEQALRTAQERAETILRSITDAFFSLDREWRFVYVNPESERQLRHAAADLLGRNVWEVFPRAEAFRKHYEAAAASGCAEHFTEYYEPLESWFEVHAYPSPEGLSVYHRDVTARRRVREQAARAQESLRRSEARLGLLSRTAGRLLATDDPQALVEDLCREVMQHLDCQVFFNFLVHADAARLRLNACAGIPPEEARRIEWLDYGAAVCGRVAKEGRRIVAEDILHSTEPMTALVRGFGVQAYCCHPLLEGQRVMGTLSFGTRTRAHFEDEEIELMRTVADQVATAMQRVESTRALARANQSLREADRRKNEFLAMLSHELRNPLAPIRNSLYILDRAAPGGEQAHRALQIIDRQVGQLSALVNDLLDVTRITRNKIQLQLETLELNEAVCRALEDHRSLFEQSGVRIRLRAAATPAFVRADATRLAQIVGNLLQNSAKFTPRGGCTRVSVAIEDGEGVVRVADDGVGMAPDTLARLFQPFMQADQSLERSMGGLGMGLALVKGLVELHGGTIAGRSEGVGRGSEFTFRLPLVPEPAHAPASGAGGNGRHSRRVLIIEDNADAADSLCELLELSGHVVAVAYDGPTGLARARAFRPEVVLCDIGLPGMDGYEVARALRKEPALRETLLVALSGYALPEDLRRAAEAGFARHLAKPPTTEQLAQVLTAASVADPSA